MECKSGLSVRDCGAVAFVCYRQKRKENSTNNPNTSLELHDEVELPSVCFPLREQPGEVPLPRVCTGTALCACVYTLAPYRDSFVRMRTNTHPPPPTGDSFVRRSACAQPTFAWTAAPDAFASPQPVTGHRGGFCSLAGKPGEMVMHLFLSLFSLPGSIAAAWVRGESIIASSKENPTG